MQLGMPADKIYLAPLSHPSLLGRFYEQYIAAGAKLLKACTLCSYLAHSYNKMLEIGRAATTIALLSRGDRVDINVAGVLSTPPGNHDDYYRATLTAFAEAGLHTLLLDTVTSLSAAAKAIEASREIMPDTDIILSAAITGESPFMADGSSYDDLISFAKDNCISTVGLNCGLDTVTACRLMRQLAAHSDGLRLYFAPSCGTPDNIIPSARWAHLVDALASAIPLHYLGPCCHGTPEYLCALRNQPSINTL